MNYLLAIILFFSTSMFFSQDLLIAFGSCGHQNKPLTILEDIAALKPDYFVYLGDNIYGDTRDINVLRNKYRQLADNSSFQKLKANTKILATWDDHDYGEDDAGKYYPMKNESKQIFLEFFEETKNSERFKHEGIYTSYMFKKKCKRIQLVLLDNRTFRSNLRLFEKGMSKDTVFNYSLQYIPEENADSTLLGIEQWAWLETQLKKKADVRIIGSSTQFGISYNGYEAWANFPKEREKMLDLIRKTKANGVVFISGDVHYGELSKLENPGSYPIYDLTASGLTQSWHSATPNANRVEGPIMENHFGMLDFDLKNNTIRLQIVDRDKTLRINYSVKWDVLK